jgi:hypothetical protein
LGAGELGNWLFGAVKGFILSGGNPLGQQLVESVRVLVEIPEGKIEQT